MTRQIRRSLRHDDSGASLAMALIFVAVVAVVIGTVLSFADVNFRTTSALRDQAEAAAAADGAGQIAVNALRKSQYAGTGDCLGPSNTLLLPSTFYDIPSGGKASAAVTCSLDTALSASDGGLIINSTNKPPVALATRRSNSNLFNGFEDSLEIDVPSKIIDIKGPIASNNNIEVDSGVIRSSSTVKARGSCTALRVRSTPMPPTCDTNSDPGGDPGTSDPRFALPTLPTNSPTLPTCNQPNRVLSFPPGRYEGLKGRALVRMMESGSDCRGSTFYFPPGVYVFDLDRPWVIDTGTVVAGRPVSGTEPPVNPTVPGSCKSAVPPVPTGPWTKQDPGDGTVFVFANETHIELGNAQFEICGPYSTTKPPIALYGIRDVSHPDRQSGCVDLSILDGFFGCPAIRTTYRANNKFVVQGTTYMPRAAIHLSITGSSIQRFRAGVVARSVEINMLPVGGDLSYPVVELPDDAVGTGLRIVVNLSVFVCPGASTCAPGAPEASRLNAKVAINDPSGSVVLGQRQVTVLNWNVER